MNNQIPDNPNINVLKASESGIFTNYIYKAIPLAFDESMSYYETLCGLLNYLQTVIIPTVNNNADAVAELQNLYIELKTFVDNYFTNLDVQQEINNKLDSMAEDGSLTALIKGYIDPLYQAYENQINASLQKYENQIDASINQMNDDIDVIDNKVTSIANGSPLVASSTSGMTDTTRTYVNTTDGYWYWYNGTEWVQGGVYQSTQVGDNSINNSMLKGKITDDKREYGNNYLNLATSIVENKVVTGYNQTTYLPNYGNSDYMNTYVFKSSDLLQYGDYFKLPLTTRPVTQQIIAYTEDTRAQNYTKTTLGTSTYFYDETENVFYFPISSTYEYYAISLDKANNNNVILLRDKADYVKKLENNMNFNKNINDYNIKMTNILNYATEIKRNKTLNGYDSTTRVPKYTNTPYSDVYIFNTSDIPSTLYSQIYYYLNTKTNTTSVIVPYTAGTNAGNVTKSSIQNNADYNPNTNYFKMPTRYFTDYTNLAISIDSTNNKYNFYSDLWNAGNPNYVIVNQDENQTKIITPSKIYGVTNKDCMIYYNNMLKYGIANKFQACTITNAKNYTNFGVINSDTTGSSNRNFTIYKTNTYNDTITKQFSFVNTSVNAGNNVTKNVMFIGDSLTDAGKYEQKLKTLFDNDVMSINMVGTRGTAPYKNEGRSGWRAYTYVNCANGSEDLPTLTASNPFYNPTTNIFDFSYYMTNANINVPDYVFICLGTNDLARGNHNTESDIISYYDTMINSIKDYNANIKIVLWLPPVHGTLNNTDVLFTNYNYVFKMKEYLINNYDNRTNENIYLVPSDLSINSDTDFGTTNQTICGEEITTVNDYIHPNNNGYDKIAYPLYYIIKYLGSL